MHRLACHLTYDIITNLSAYFRLCLHQAELQAELQVELQAELQAELRALRAEQSEAALELAAREADLSRANEASSQKLIPGPGFLPPGYSSFSYVVR